MITASVLDEKSGVIAGRAECALRQVDSRKDPVRWSPRILNAKPPWTITHCPSDVHIATELNHEIVEAPLAQDASGTIDCISFPNAAEVHDHAFTTEERCPRSFVHNQVSIIEEAEPAGDFTTVRNRPVLILIIELPE